MDVQFIKTLEFGTFSKNFKQFSTTFGNAPFPVSQYWYCNVALSNCRSLSTRAASPLLLGPWQVCAQAIPAAVRFSLSGYAKTHQAKEIFRLTAKKKKLVLVMHFLAVPPKSPSTYIRPNKFRSHLKVSRRQYWRVRTLSNRSTFVR